MWMEISVYGEIDIIVDSFLYLGIVAEDTKCDCLQTSLQAVSNDVVHSLQISVYD